MATTEQPPLAGCSGSVSAKIMDCGTLVSHVQQQEASLSSSAASLSTFGHTPPPQLVLCQTAVIGDFANSQSSSSCCSHVLIAYTQRCVSAQYLGIEQQPTNAVDESREPICVLCLPTVADSTAYQYDEEEIITCVEAISGLEQRNDNDETRQYAVPDPLILAQAATCIGKLVVVVGTSHSRVLCVELNVLQLHSHGNLLPNERPPTFLRLEDGIPFEPLPHDTSFRMVEENNSNKVNSDEMPNSSRKVIIEPFQPYGGVGRISSFRVPQDNNNNRTITMVWISYRDGTVVRIDSTSLFVSTFETHTSSSATTITTSTTAQNPQDTSTANGNDTSHTPYIQRLRLCLPAPFSLSWTNPVDDHNSQALIILPLPKYHASTALLPPGLDPMAWNDISKSCDDDMTQDNNNNNNNVAVEVLVIAGTSSTGIGGVPTLVFYTSDDYLVTLSKDGTNYRKGGNQSMANGDVLDVVLGGTKAIVSGVVGSALGAVKWGLGSDRRKQSTAARGDDVMTMNSEEPTEIAAAEKYPPTFEAIHKRPPINLVAGFEMHDTPRQVTFATIDPSGNFAATADSLGRVLLLDLATKQVIRMWKGFRETSCYWLQVSLPLGDKNMLYLVIHSKPRRVVEVWRTRHGPRVLSIQVSRDAQIVSCREIVATPNGNVVLSKCYLVHSVPQEGTAGSSNRVEELVVNDNGLGLLSSEGASYEGLSKRNPSSAISPAAQKDAALRLQMLQQLLADTNVPCQSQDVFEALTKITSLKDLALALDLTAVSQSLERKMGVDGASFQAIAVHHCQDTLDKAANAADGDATTNPNFKLLKLKVDYYKQVVGAFEVLHKFETAACDEYEDQRVAPRSAWAIEAIGWTTIYEKVTGSSIDADIVPMGRESLLFATFAKACEPPNEAQHSQAETNGRFPVFLSDSSRTRKDVLVHIFKPLLGDIFSFNMVNSIFDYLGIKEDNDYLLKCFGEWFNSISALLAAQKGLFGLYSLQIRWLQDIVVKEIELFGGSMTASTIFLKALHDFCSKSSDLCRAFMLATMCREAVAIATRQREEKSYGKISSSEAVNSWDNLLRKIRVCLLVSLRLSREQLGSFPISVYNVDQDDIFSVYEWLARDELNMSHKHNEIVSLENACRMSGYAFNPSTVLGDEPMRVNMLQKSCLSSSISEAERAEYLVDFEDDDRMGALLLFLGHYNDPPLLAAHRALLLALKWTATPADIDLLRDTLVALQSLSEDDNYKILAAAVRMEVWQARIRPFCRALLFGFNDVHELMETVAAALFHKQEWVHSFVRIALEILALLSRFSSPLDDGDVVVPSFMQKARATESLEYDTLWPPKKQDFILQRLVKKLKAMDPSAVDTHRVVLCAVLASLNIAGVSNLVPGFYDSFSPMALFCPPAPIKKHKSTTSIKEKRHAFLEDCIIARAQSIKTGDEQDTMEPLDSLDLGEVDVLAHVWGIDLKDVRTLFLLAMYEFGKDRLVDELLSKFVSQISVSHFVEDGLDICCRRLNEFLHGNRLAAQQRHVIGMLDADMCEWIRERAEKSQPLALMERLSVPLTHTHLFVLRLLNLCPATAASKATRVKIHSMSVLSGTLLRALPGEQ